MMAVIKNAAILPENMEIKYLFYWSIKSYLKGFLDAAPFTSFRLLWLATNVDQT
jgi:hypothetical protein